MGHLTNYQLQELLSGDCCFFIAWLRRRHILKCDECRRRSEALGRELEEERRMGEDLKKYREISIEATATMKIKK